MKNVITLFSVVLMLAGPSLFAQTLPPSFEVGERVIVVYTDKSSIMFGIWPIADVQIDKLIFANGETRTFEQVVALKTINKSNSCNDAYDAKNKLCSCDVFFKDALNRVVVAVLPKEIVHAMGQALPNIIPYVHDTPIRDRFNSSEFFNVVSIGVNEYQDDRRQVHFGEFKGEAEPWVEGFMSTSIEKVDRHIDPSGTCFNSMAKASPPKPIVTSEK